MNEYEMACTCQYEGFYNSEEIELNNKLYEECSKEELDCDAIEKLLIKGADPLGATAISGWGLLDHIYSELVMYSEVTNSANLPIITELFLKHGMQVTKPRIPYDCDNSIHPMWMFSFVPNENTIVALKLLLDNGLDADATEVFLEHSIDDQINVHRDDPYEYEEWFVWTFKMIMLIASYDYILEADEGLRRFIGCEYNSYNIHHFANWDDYEYVFDTSRCDSYPELYKSVVHIYEKKTQKEVWKIGVCLKVGEF